MVENKYENCFKEAFGEEAFSSINIMCGGEHFDYCITTWLIQRHWGAWGHETCSVWGRCWATNLYLYYDFLTSIS